jgi:predicted MFS family arabinose efflux permease
VLAGAIFVVVSSEFLPTGVLPQIAAELRVSESQVGLLVTVFAVAVVATAAPLAILTRRFSRKWLLVVLLGIFALSNVLAALAPGYEFLAGARVLGGLAHGLFWAVAGPYTALLVPRKQLARAVAITTSGGSLAFVIGVPAGAAIGQLVGWRLSFVVMAVATVVFLALVVVLLPPVQHRVPLATGEIALPVRRDRSFVAFGIIAVSILLTAGAHNLLYTYIAPWSIGVGGVDEHLVSVVLLFFGAAGAVGLALGGTFGDRAPRLTVNLMTAGIVVALAVLALFGHGLIGVIVGMVLWSAAFGGLPALFQTRALHGSSARMRDLSGAVVTTAFNLAIGGGAFVGGLVLDGVGLESLPWFAMGGVLCGLVWTLATDRARIRAHPAEAHLG